MEVGGRQAMHGQEEKVYEEPCGGSLPVHLNKQHLQDNLLNVGFDSQQGAWYGRNLA